VRAPASKSSMQRATACALLSGAEAGRPSVLRSPSRSSDCLAALGVVSELGASVEDLGGRFEIRGASERERHDEKNRSLSCGESGLCMRMFSPIAALYAGEAELRAEGTLRSRRVDMIASPLAELGARCETASSGLPPVKVRGVLRGGRAKVDGRESSQLLTGLLVALPLAEGDSVLEVDCLASRGYVDLTLDTMRAFGVQAERDPDYRLFRIRGSQSYRATDFTVEGDWSGAAFLLVAGALAANGSGLSVEGLGPRSSQPDRAILEALRLAGAVVDVSDACIHVRRNSLEAFEFDASDCPDLFPPLVALAAVCDGTTVLRGARRLSGKESDRAAALSEGFNALGAAVIVEGDEMRVRGRVRLTGGRMDARGDHRIAMAATVAALVSSAPVEIDGAECVAKSWPSFFEDFASVSR